MEINALLVPVGSITGTKLITMDDSEVYNKQKEYVCTDVNRELFSDKLNEMFDAKSTDTVTIDIDDNKYYIVFDDSFVYKKLKINCAVVSSARGVVVVGGNMLVLKKNTSVDQDMSYYDYMTDEEIERVKKYFAFLKENYYVKAAANLVLSVTHKRMLKDKNALCNAIDEVAAKYKLYIICNIIDNRQVYVLQNSAISGNFYIAVIYSRTGNSISVCVIDSDKQEVMIEF